MRRLGALIGLHDKITGALVGHDGNIKGALIGLDGNMIAAPLGLILIYLRGTPGATKASGRGARRRRVAAHGKR